MATKKVKQAARPFSLISDETFRQMHTAMTTLRTSAKRNAASRGDEAALVATTLDLRPGDLILAPAGLFPETLVANGHLRFSAKLRGSSKKIGVPILSPSTASAVVTIAVGAALGRQTAASNTVNGSIDDSVIVAFGSTSHQDSWLEALHLTGLHHLPMLFVLLPGEEEVEAACIGSKAVDAGIITIPVDAADAVAMYRAAFESLARARRRTSSTLIVSTPYKIENTRPQRAEDPVRKLGAYLKTRGVSLTAR